MQVFFGENRSYPNKQGRTSIASTRGQYNFYEVPRRTSRLKGQLLCHLLSFRNTHLEAVLSLERAARSKPSNPREAEFDVIRLARQYTRTRANIRELAA
jgi:hypothetical protein